MTRWRIWLQTHQDFLLLLALFISFRGLTLFAFRPGGQVQDFSDFYFYRSFAELSREGYVPYDNLWTTYPPLFPLLMINLWKLSALVPPWENANLWFTMLLGGTFLLFESGNLLLIYLLSRRIHAPEAALRPVWLYALFFAPVYTLTGWFESYPLFFFLLSLYLVVRGKPYWAAFFSGIGFMIKLIPLLLLPIGAKHLPAHSRWRLQIPPLNVDLDLPRFGLYLIIFFGTIIAIALPWYRLNPDLIFSPLQMTGLRPAWQSIWALLDGNFDYGIIQLDMRNLDWRNAPVAESNLPWLWITAAFGLGYTLLFTRRINWPDPRVTLAFTGLTICTFFLYSKGYSPQWLGWLLVFVALLLPNWRGVIYAILLDVANIVEANLYITIFPDEHWLLVTTVLLRTGLVVLLGLEFALLVWPNLARPPLLRWRNRFVGLALLGLVLALPLMLTRLGNAYFEFRLTNSPYRESITWLQEQPVQEALLLNSHDVYDWYYPYLRESHHFYMLDRYEDADLAADTTALLEQIAAQHEALWVYDYDPAVTTAAETALQQWLGNTPPAHQADIDGGRLYLYILAQRTP